VEKVYERNEARDKATVEGISGETHYRGHNDVDANQRGGQEDGGQNRTSQVTRTGEQR
jgi:hypothetical protein